MHKKLLFIFTVFFISIISSYLTAEPIYSLSELCKIANTNALQIKISKDDLKISELEKKRALSVLLPSLTAFGSKNRTYTKYDDQLRNYKMDNTTDTETIGIQIDQSFTLNGKELIALKVTKDEIEKSEFNLETTKSNYMFEVATAYYQVLSANKNLDIFLSDVKRLEKHRNSVNEKLQVGTVTKTALYRAEAELSKAKTNLLRAENNLKFSKESLKNLVDIKEDFSVSDNREFYSNDFKITFENLIKDALENRTELKSVQKNLEIANKTISYERGSYWPKLSIQGTYGDSEIISDKDDYDDLDRETNAREKSLQASVSFTIFDGGLRRAQISQAIARKRQADAVLVDTRNKITLESKKAWFDYETAKSTLVTLDDELTSATENFNAVTMQFEYGLSDSVDMMDADTLLVSAQQRLAEAEYTYILTILDMVRIKGGLLELLL